MKAVPPPPRSGSSRSGYRGPIPPPQEDDFIEKIAWLLDRSIPIGKYSIGLDPIIGLIPGFGDFAAAAISSTIVLHAYRRGIPKATLMRMVANVGIDAVVGAIPIFGDLFDFAFKASTRNLQLYREAVAGVRDTRQDTTFLLVLALCLGILVAAPILLVIWAVQYVAAI